VHQTSLSLLVLAFAAFVAMLYRFGPERGAVPDRALLPGVILATVIWLAASMALTLYVNHMSSFGATYGSLGAVAGVMLWLYAAAYAVLLGAEMNARVEAFRRGN
jgi:membrane protein